MTRPDKIDMTKHLREALDRKTVALAKYNTLFQSLNPTPRSHRYGRNWRPSPPAYRDPAGGADPAKPGTDTTVYSWQALGGLTVLANVATTRAGTPTLDIVHIRLPEPEPPPPIPYAGVRVGEIVGYRAWWVAPHNVRTCDWNKPANIIDSVAYQDRSTWRLRSLASSYLWQPGQVVLGKIDKVINEYWDPWTCQVKQIFGGVYAFRSPKLDESTQSNIRQIQSGWGDGRPLAIGTCTLWGDVVEHEHGYRASHARLRSIDAVYGADCLAELRSEYGLEVQP